MKIKRKIWGGGSGHGTWVRTWGGGGVGGQDRGGGVGVRVDVNGEVKFL